MSLRVQKLHVSALLHQPVIEASVLVRDECGVVEGGAAEVLAAGQRLGADYGQEELRDILSVETHGLVKCCQAALVFRVERFPADLSGLLLQQVYITRDTCAVNIADVILQQGSENSACHTTLAGVLTRCWGTASSSLDTLVLVVRWVSSSPPQPSHTHSSRLLRSLGTK